MQMNVRVYDINMYLYVIYTYTHISLCMHLRCFYCFVFGPWLKQMKFQKGWQFFCWHLLPLTTFDQIMNPWQQVAQWLEGWAVDGGGAPRFSRNLPGSNNPIQSLFMKTIPRIKNNHDKKLNIYVYICIYIYIYGNDTYIYI